MVSTRSGRSTKHDAPTPDKAAPAKKQKVSGDKAKPVEENGKSNGEHEEKHVEEKKVDEKAEAPKGAEKKEKSVANGKPATNDVDMKNGVDSRKADEQTPVVNDTEKKDEPVPKPPVEGSEATKAEEQTTGGAPRDTQQAGSPILEKGVFYFFFRPRVNVGQVSSLTDVQKSYLLLRNTKSDPASATKTVRIIQIPKKALPATGTHERFLGFVIASEENVKELKDDIGESHYSTATRGERLQGASRPVAEGVYALVGDPDGRTTHFAYSLTIPQHASEVQKEFGLSDQGSFVMSTRNPQTPAPPQARGLQGAQYPEKILEQFRGRRWMNLLPEHLEHQFTQLLFIGEKKSAGTGEVLDQLEKLEEEDEQRIKHLHGEDAVFKDLQLSKDEFKPAALHGDLE